MTEGNLPLYFLPLMVLVFVLFWSTIVALIAWLSGWRRLAASFAATYQPSGERLSWQSARIGRTSNYSGILTIVVAPEGLLLSVMVLFRPGHPPLFIPWEYVTAAETGTYFGRSLIKLTITPKSGSNPVTLQFFGKRLTAAITTHLPPTTSTFDNAS